jgi:Tfp pilus assembly protein PilV
MLAAFTLVEAMVSTVIFTMCMLGVYTIEMRSYNISSLTRYRDNARAILQSYADQFERLQTTDSNGFTVWLFNKTNGDYTGEGLLWDDNTGTPQLSDESTSAAAATDAAGLNITLGNNSSGIPATVTRLVESIDPSTGASTTGSYTAAGYLLRGTFSITFVVAGSSYSQSLTVLRAVP